MWAKLWGGGWTPDQCFSCASKSLLLLVPGTHGGRRTKAGGSRDPRGAAAGGEQLRVNVRTPGLRCLGESWGNRRGEWCAEPAQPDEGSSGRPEAVKGRRGAQRGAGGLREAAEGRRGAFPSGSVYSHPGCGARDGCPRSIPRCPPSSPGGATSGAPQPAAATPRLSGPARVFQLENEHKSAGKFGPLFRMAPTNSLFTPQSEAVRTREEFVLSYPGITLCTPSAHLSQ